MTSRDIKPAQFGRFIWRRTRSDAILLLAVALGVLIASTVLAGAWVYIRSLERLGVSVAVAHFGSASLNLNATNRQMPFTKDAFEAGSRAFARAIRNLGDLTNADGYFIRTPGVLWGPAEEGVRVDVTAPPAVLQKMAHLGSNVSYVAGRAPSEIVNFEGEFPVVEVAVPAERAEETGVSVGDILEVGPTPNEYGRIIAVVTGLFEPVDIGSPFWGGLGPAFLAPEPLVPDTPIPLVLFLRGDAIWDVTAESTIAVGTGRWFGYLDAEVLRNSLPSDFIERTEEFQQEIQKAIPRVWLLRGPMVTFQGLERRALFARIPTFLIGTLLITVTAYYLLMVAGLIVERRRADIAMLRSRGISTLQLARLYALEVAPLVGVPVLIAPFLSMLLISQIGKLGAYRDITGGTALSTELSWVPFALSGAAGLVALAVLLTPVVLQARGNVVAERRAASRPSRTPFFQRYYLDVALLVLGGLILWELQTRGTVVASDLAGERSADISTLFGPALLLAASALIFLRFFPLILTVVSWMIGRRAPVWVTLALWKLARTPYHYAWPILLFVLASGLGVLSASLASTLELSTAERIAYATAGDFRLSGVRAAGGANGETLQTLRSIPGVTGVSIGIRERSRLGTTDTGREFQLLAVDPKEFARVSWFREDFAPLGLGPLLDSVYVPDRPPRILFPEGAQEVGMWARAEPPADNLFLWVVVRDTDGRSMTMTLGPIQGPGWHYQSAPIPERVKQPAELASVLIFQPAAGDSGTPTTLSLDDLSVKYLRSDGELVQRVIVPFENREDWAVLPTSEGLDTSFSLTPEFERVGPDEGRWVGRLELGRGTDSGIRGLYRAIGAAAIPVVASESFMQATGKNVGDSFVARAFGVFTPFQIVETAKYFPTLDPDRGGFLIADYEVLFDYLKFRGQFLPVGRDEVYFSIDGAEIDEILPQVREVVGRSAHVEDRDSLARRALIDPLAIAGWRGMAVVAIAGTLAVAALGYVTYLVAYVARGRTETAFLRALGLSRSAYIRMVAFEHLMVAVIGLGLGTAVGLAMSRIAVESVAHTETGARLLPPFVLTTQWLSVGLIYATLAVVGAFAAARMARAFGRQALNQITRIEE